MPFHHLNVNCTFFGKPAGFGVSDTYDYSIPDQLLFSLYGASLWILTKC